MEIYRCRRCGDAIIGSTRGDAEAHELVHHDGQRTTYQSYQRDEEG